jgi:CMP/dCMP kinase
VQWRRCLLRRSAASTAIAIDGPVASGKSSVGSRVAATLHWPFVDTGTMYRAITWLLLERETDLNDAAALGILTEQATMRVLPPAPGSHEYATVIVDGQDATPHLRTPAVERAVSVVSAVSRVREQMVSLQRSLITRQAVVMAGRDIGTVVLPDAQLKIFLDASAQIRALRRVEELARAGRPRAYADVLAETLQRDQLDSNRADSPLAPASDAVIIDTGTLSEDEVVRRILDLARSVYGTEV